MFDVLWFNLLFNLLYPMYKWIVRMVTGKCEILRITLQYPQSYERTSRIESSLSHSKKSALKQLLAENNINLDDAIINILKVKLISPEIYPGFGPTLRVCLNQICGYRQLIVEVEALRKTQFSTENKEHEALLTQLWKTLKPNIPLNGRFSKQWTDIGFQGDDPTTDFRGMGLLGLQNLVFFVEQYTDAARQLLSHSNHASLGYSFAIVGINITGMAYQLLNQGLLKSHLYNVVHGKPRIEHFNYIYCYLLYEFDKFWFAESPPSIMEFNHYKEKFQKQIVTLLKDKNTMLRLKFNREYNNHMASMQL